MSSDKLCTYWLFNPTELQKTTVLEISPKPEHYQFVFVNT